MNVDTTAKHYCQDSLRCELLSTTSRMSGVLTYPSEQLTTVKSGLQRSMKLGRRRPVDSLPTFVMIIVSDTPNQNI